FFGCGGSSHDMKFHGEADVLPGFNWDSGLVPSGVPVQVELSVTAAGKVSVDAGADQGGPADKPTVVGRRGSGELKIEGGFKLTGRLKADLTGLRYDGNIPGLDNTDLKFHGETAFDPFLLGGAKATATAEIPETMLPPIPLPGGLTGQLIITIAKGSTVSVDFSGVCAG